MFINYLDTFLQSFPEIWSFSERNFGDEVVYFSEKFAVEIFRTDLDRISFKK